MKEITPSKIPSEDVIKTNSSISDKLKSITPLKMIIFLSIFFILDVVLLGFSVKIRKDNKKLEEDNLIAYEFLEMNNVSRTAQGRRIKYLENIIEDNGIYLDPLYHMDIIDDTYKEYEDTIKEFKKVNINEVMDQYLNMDYSKKMYEKRKTAAKEESEPGSYSEYKNSQND